PDVLRAQAPPRRTGEKQGKHGRPGKAKACILIWLFGGPSHIDTWDLKPDAPAEFRGEFKSIQTTAPAIRLCEHLPRSAGVAHHPARSGGITGYINPGQFAGLLGPACEPVLVRGTLDRPRELAAPQFLLPADVDAGRFGGRLALLHQVEGWQRHVERGGVL